MIGRKMTRAHAAVLAGLVLAISAPATAQQARRDSDAAEEQKRIAALLQMLVVKVDGLTATTQQLGQKVESLAKRNDALAQRNDALAQRNESLVLQNREMLEARQSLKRAHDQLATALKTEAELRQRTVEEVEKLRDRLESAQRENRQLVEQLARKQAMMDAMDKRVQVLREREIQHQQAREELEARPKKARSPKAASAQKKILATITAVKDNVASIDRGTRHGVGKGMRLIIYRDDKFIGYLSVAVVDLDQAAGFVTTKALDVKAGDKVTNSLSKD